MTNCYIRFHYITTQASNAKGSVVVRQRCDGYPDGEKGMLEHLRRFFLDANNVGVICYPEEAAVGYIVWRSMQDGRTLPEKVLGFAMDNLAIAGGDERFAIRYTYDVWMGRTVDGVPKIEVTKHDYSHTLPPEIRELARKADEANKKEQ